MRLKFNIILKHDSIEPSWKAFFQGYDFGSESYGSTGEIVEGVSTQIPEQVQKEFQVIKLIDGYRTRGHLFTKTNPVRDRRKYQPSLELENFGLSSVDLDTIFNAGEVIGIGPQSLRVIIEHLEATLLCFCQFEHTSTTRQTVEIHRHRSAAM